MLAFTLDPRRWWIARPLSRNPLLRAADRLEALIILVVIVGWLLVVPIRVRSARRSMTAGIVFTPRRR